MGYGIVMNGVKFTTLIGDGSLMKQAENLSKKLHEAKLSKYVTSIDMGMSTTHISTTSERDKIMKIAQENITSDITCD